MDSGLDRQSESFQCLGEQNATAGVVLARSLHVPDEFPDGRATGKRFTITTHTSYHIIITAGVHIIGNLFY